MTPKTQLKVDLLKIACLLRVADVLHLDRRRAPPFVRALDRPGGLSAMHWAFQSKLALPHVEDDAIVFTAGEPCTIEEAESWWCAFDAFGLADRELRDADLLLRDQRRSGLKARRIKGANNPDELVRLVPVSGWKPVETRVHISDIPRIVEMFGGTSLYGEDPTVPVRELLQNAMDAIQARRRLQNRASWGLIRVELSSRRDGVWLSVEDDGVGSEHVLTGSPLDFGSSFWRSTVVTEEFPTLAARGMNAVGRFGIGFFSVFMLGEEVRVITRRTEFKLAQDLIIIPTLSKDFMHPVCFGRDGLRTSLLLSVFEDLLQNVWGGFEEFENYEYPVGSVWGEDIIRPVNIYSRSSTYESP